MADNSEELGYTIANRDWAWITIGRRKDLGDPDSGFSLGFDSQRSPRLLRKHVAAMLRELAHRIETEQGEGDK